MLPHPCLPVGQCQIGTGLLGAYSLSLLGLLVMQSLPRHENSGTVVVGLNQCHFAKSGREFVRTELGVSQCSKLVDVGANSNCKLQTLQCNPVGHKAQSTD